MDMQFAGFSEQVAQATMTEDGVMFPVGEHPFALSVYRNKAESYFIDLEIAITDALIAFNAVPSYVERPMSSLEQAGLDGQMAALAVTCGAVETFAEGSAALRTPDPVAVPDGYEDSIFLWYVEYPSGYTWPLCRECARARLGISDEEMTAIGYGIESGQSHFPFTGHLYHGREYAIVDVENESSVQYWTEDRYPHGVACHACGTDLL